MGKSILTPKQYQFLELAKKDPWLTKNFFLTGGTALAEFYLHHRYSLDLDFFSEKEIKERSIRVFLKKISTKLGVRSFTIEGHLGLHICHLTYKGKESLKVDFSYYPFPPIEKWTYFGSLRIASVYDIAVDKVQTISGKARARDYIDLYFILQKEGFEIKKILSDIRNKYDWIIGPETLSSQFLRVKDLEEEEFPKMLVSFNKKRLEDFFLKLAKSLEKEIFK